MAQADPGRSPASHSMGVGSAHDGPGTGTCSVGTRPVPERRWGGVPGQEDPDRVQGPGAWQVLWALPLAHF